MEENAMEVSEVVADVAVATANNADKIEKLEIITGLMDSTVYVIGFSFILGVVFTIFILLVLDFMRRNKQDDE